MLQSQLRLLQAQAQEKAKQSPELLLRRILTDSAAAAQSKGDVQAELLTLRAKALRLLARWQQATGRRPAALASVEQGLGISAAVHEKGHGGWFALQLEEGALLSLKAQLLSAGVEQKSAATQAVTTLTAGRKNRPPMAREFSPYLQAAEKLAQ